MPEGFRIATAFVQVSPDTEGFKEELQGKLDEATAGIDGKVRVGLDTAELDAKVDEARAKVDELDSKRVEPSVHLNAADLDAKSDEARAKLDELDSKSARPDVGLSASDLDARVDEARAKLDELDAKHADPRLGLDDADFNAKVDRAEARLDALNAKSAEPRVGGSGGAGGEGFGGGGGGEGGGLLGAITMGLGALMPGVGGAAMGLGMLGGVGAMALGPVAKAISEAHQASMNVGMTPQQLAATQFQNSVQVQQAQQNVTMAQQQAAQDAVTSSASIRSAQSQLGMSYEQASQDAASAAQQTESAQMNLASVVRNAAASQIQAVQSVEHAEQSLEQANYGLSEAQYNLNQAWVQAREEIVQLNDQLADSRINVQSAQLAIQQALYQQRLVDQNAYSTQLDREQAALAVVRAQQQLKDAQDQSTNAQYAANLANQQGVEHSQTLIQAKQGLVQAQYAQTDAQEQYADAQRNLTNTELNNATQVKEAQMQVAAAQRQAAYQQLRDSEQIQQAQRQLAQAQEQASYTQMRDAENVAVAERNVANTLKEQQLQWAATMSTENQAANQFAKDMSRLSPAGRAFVEQVLSMSGAFRDLEAAAQNAVLPGFTAFLQGLQVLMPTIQQGVTQMGQAIANAFAAVGQLMSTPEFATALNGLISNGVEFANTVLPAFAQFAEMLGWIGSQQGAVSGIANLLAGIAHALTGMAAGLGDSMPAINQFLTAAGNLIAQIGPGLAQIIGLIAQTLEPLTSYLNAHPNGTIVTLLGQIVAAMILFRPLVGIVSAPFRALTLAVDSISGLPAKLKAIVEKIVSAWGGLGALSSESGAAAGAIGGAAAGTTSAASKVVMLDAASAPVANRGVLGPVSILSGGSTLADMMGPLGIAGAAAALGLAITYFADRVRQASDQAKGVIEHSSGELTAATSVSGQHVSDNFRTMANNIADSAQSSGVTVERGGQYAASRFGNYTQNWSTHNNALVNVMQLGKGQMGQAFAQFATGMGINVQQVGASLRQQGKTMNQAYVDTMQEVFANLGGQTKASWAQAEQVMTTSLDKYYSTMRQTTTNDYNSMQQAVIQLTTDGYHHRTDLETQDIQKLGQVVTQYETDKTNHLIDTSKSNINQLSADVARYMADLAQHNSTAAQADLEQLKKDLVNKFDDVASSVDKSTSHTLDQEISSAQSDIARIQQSIPLPFAHAEGGLITGPGTGTSDSIPAWLSNGEFVVNAKSTAAFRPLLESINSRFAAGGFVDVAAPRSVNDRRSFVEQLTLQQMQGATAAGGAGIPGQFAGSVAQWIAQAMAVTGVSGPDWVSGLDIIIANESSGNPNAINLTDSNAAAGDPSRGLMQTIGSTFDAYHASGTSWNIYDPIANIAAGIRYIEAVYGGIDNVPGVRSVRSGGGYLPYDSGGWLMPGDMPVNGLGKPEAVLTPQESEAFVQIVRQLTAQQGSVAGMGAKHATVNFYGTQYPNAEQMAAIKREMALALGGAS